MPLCKIVNKQDVENTHHHRLIKHKTNVRMHRKTQASRLTLHPSCVPLATRQRSNYDVRQRRGAVISPAFVPTTRAPQANTFATMVTPHVRRPRCTSQAQHSPLLLSRQQPFLPSPVAATRLLEQQTHRDDATVNHNSPPVISLFLSLSPPAVCLG